MGSAMAGTDPELQLIEDITRFEHDPLGFVRYVYPWGEKGSELEHETGPRKWQAAFLSEVGRLLRNGAATNLYEAIQMATASGHGIGKSAVVAWLVDWGISTREDARIIVTANTDKQLQSKTWPEVQKWHRLSINRHWFIFTATSLHSADPAHEKTWRADAIPWSEHNTEAFAGLHNAGKRIVLIFDEASKIADKVWEVAQGALTDEGTEMIWAVFGNPTRATGRFRECFRKFRHRWSTRSIDSREVEGTNKTEIAKLVADHGEDSDIVKVRVRGMFPAQSVKQFISETDVDAAFGRGLRQGSFEWAPKIISVDPAWEGDDEFVIAMRQGLLFQVLRVYPKNDNDVEMANIIARLEEEHQADAVFIDLGYGTGLYSVGLALGRTWILVNFAEKAYDEGCLNKRAEMWKLTRDWLKAGGAIPKDQQLRDDLIGPETVPRLDGKIQLESKDDMKSRGIPSPNRGDALALTFAHPVQARHRALSGRGKNNSLKSDWDPLAENAA